MFPSCVCIFMWIDEDYNPFHPSWIIMHAFTSLFHQTHLIKNTTANRSGGLIFAFSAHKKLLFTILVRPFVRFLWSMLILQDWNWCGKVYSGVNGSVLSPSLCFSCSFFFSFSLPPTALCAETANPDRRLGPELWALCQCLQCVIFSLSACFWLWNSPPF